MSLAKGFNKDTVKKNQDNQKKISDKHHEKIYQKFTNITAGKKKIILITSISTAVLIFSLGLGLGLGLETSSSEISTPRTPSTYYNTAAGVGVTDLDIEKGKVTINEEEYVIEKKDDAAFLKIPAFNGKLSPNLVRAIGMFDVNGKEYTKNEVKGEGRNNFYDLNFLIPTMNIGVVRIPNDGKIYGGYVDAESEDQDYKVSPILEKVYPNGYEIGAFYHFDTDIIEGRGGINMLKLEKLLTLLTADSPFNSEAEVATALENVATTTRFGFFKYKEGEPETDYLRMATNGKATKPSEIGYAPTEDYPDRSLLPGGDNQKYWWEDAERISLSDHENNDKQFTIKSFTNQFGRSSTVLVRLEKGVDYKSAAVDVELNKLHLPITINPGFDLHPVLGMIQPDIDGFLAVDETITNENGGKATININADGTFSVPSLLIKIEKSALNAENYGTVVYKRGKGELLIEARESSLAYFQMVANDERVKKLAEKLGVTIRFKRVFNNENGQSVRQYGIYNSVSSEVFFPDVQKLTYFNKGNQLAPLLDDGILKENLDNPDYYTDTWRIDTKIHEGIDQGKYGLYPFSKVTTVLAYNTDYLPNGLDFSDDKTIADYLYQADLGSYEEIQVTANPNTVSDEQKQGLLVDAHFNIGNTVWALDYYDKLKQDQQPNQQDTAWKKITRGSGDTTDPNEKDYWTVFADPNLKDDPRFRKWVDHNYHSNSDRLNNPTVFAQSSYDKTALFNGHIGAILIDSNTIIYHGDEWRKGEWRTTGTAEEKEAFAKNKIKFQSIPVSETYAEFVAFAATLKNDKAKQKVAEMFINVLTEPNKAYQFNQQTGKVPARKDVQFADTNDDPITVSFIKAVTNTPTVLLYDLPQWVYKVFPDVNQATNSYQNDQLEQIYEDIANRFKNQALQNSGTHAIFAPEDPSGS